MTLEKLIQRDREIIQIPTKLGRLQAQKLEITFLALSILVLLGHSLWPYKTSGTNFVNLKMRAVYPFIIGIGGMIGMLFALGIARKKIFNDCFIELCIVFAIINLATWFLVNKTIHAPLPDKVCAVGIGIFGSCGFLILGVIPQIHLLANRMRAKPYFENFIK